MSIHEKKKFVPGSFCPGVMEEHSDGQNPPTVSDWMCRFSKEVKLFPNCGKINYLNIL